MVSKWNLLVGSRRIPVLGGPLGKDTNFGRASLMPGFTIDEIVQYTVLYVRTMKGKRLSPVNSLILSKLIFK